MARNKEKYLYISPSLLGKTDHHSRVLQNVLDWCGHGITWRIFSHRNSNLRSLVEQEVLAVFRHSSYWQILGRFQGFIQRIPLASFLPLLIEEYLRFADLASIINPLFSLRSFSKKSYLEIFSLGEFFALNATLSSCKNTGKCFIFVMIGFYSLRRLQGLSKIIYVWTLRLIIKQLHSKGCQFVFDNSELALYLLPNHSSLIYPYLPEINPRNASCILKDSLDTPTLVLPGLFRRNKNFEFALSTLIRLNDAGSVKMRCKMLATRHLDNVNFPWLEIIPGVLSDDDYYSLISRATFVWCAFDKKNFGPPGSSSGTLRDALLLGSIPLASPGTWMSRYLTELGLPELVLPVQRTTKHTSSALGTLISCLPSLRYKVSLVRQKIHDELEKSRLQLEYSLRS